MLLRYIALHGEPKTEEEWKTFREWKAKQLRLAECQMSDPEGSPGEPCEDCPGTPDCPKAGRRRVQG